ncbi:hypothetical protein Ahy_A05g023779 [Arachis hypogaea]|uniref:Aminotransferase-like plant mobile domain-containing protein n=1 Tax=Arachis hypogaea TaxID=3818 RepID=A0A445D4E0_ARAHY|nr:hypothetical protein Ahy_A05g023779 [Arachis hypogaea]
MEEEDRMYRLNRVAHVAGFIDQENKVKQMTVCYTWFHERFRVLPADATEDIVRIYARAYIMMLLSSQLFADKNANRVHLRWLPYVASLDDLGRYSWGSAALAWLYRCLCRGTNRNVVNLAGPLQLLQSWIFWRFPCLRPSDFNRFGFPLASRCAQYLPRNDAVDQRVVAARLCLDRLRVHDIVWEPYSTPDVAAVVHPEILLDQHRRLWTAVTSLIYFAAIEWHQVDRVMPQFGGVQHLPRLALNIDWLHAKDGRGGDRTPSLGERAVGTATAERLFLSMGDDPGRLYRLDGVAHIAGVINDEVSGL